MYIRNGFVLDGYPGDKEIRTARCKGIDNTPDSRGHAEDTGWTDIHSLDKK